MITLATLNEATEQAIFDQVGKHLLTQNKKSERNDKCVYRSPEGLKCAAGCLISDEEYNPAMDSDGEGTSWESLIKRELIETDKHKFIIRDLQRIHDDHYPDRWKSKLQDFAETNNLQWTLN
jgi:hypothetical protein